jgi:hypothetical protein
LAVALGSLIEKFSEFDGVAVTMTGELADCFQTREEGVCRILEQITSILPAPLVRVYGVDGNWMSVSQAARQPWNTAASNWHAMAQFALRWKSKSTCILVDVGSTTCDVIPLDKQGIATAATTDSQRLQLEQLVYTGIERTPVCAVVRQLPLHGQPTPVMAELFATMKDVYVWLGNLPERPNDTDTADGRPSDRQGAAFRLARMVGEDGSTLLKSDLDRLAEAAASAQAQLLASAIDRQRRLLASDPAVQFIVSGHGGFLIEAALAHLGWRPHVIDLTEKIGASAARCGPAMAVASLALEQLGDLFPIPKSPTKAR